MPSFVVEYNRRTGAVHVTEFATSGEGVRRRLELERVRVNKDIEIVSLVSDSIETVRRTHSRYFARELAPQ
ncbi:hypothetical protein Xcel_1531 [Xylanimonas cellulosilytica DSM 15894]|uniref:Uncharacterized protein n=1 Tax=Xylanimonas cellulosilytica (strain DSM 15894 / JCM 12276 / CECT 5975 / KCTC 9989 / LMG 20990 / NBRC 107835 / XIL07) TaxID=446471 RepID=D1BS69_XYLCX|nr:hypothetical protein [Xylanimonas cellulosilytica]ACZ30561.1 hypothetical protein Xcel_1531 [Xylanimonas cellulosilytica DSM 15894]